MDLRVEGALDDAEVLVAGAEQADHVDAVRDDHGVTRGVRGCPLVVAVSHGCPCGRPLQIGGFVPLHATGAAETGPASNVGPWRGSRSGTRTTAPCRRGSPVSTSRTTHARWA